MKTTKIIIKNLFGIKETTLDGRSVEITGPKGSGKTSVLDAIRFALTNRSDRDYIIHQGADEGEIIIETDTGLTIDRKTRATRADTIKVKDGAMLQTRPAEFLSGIFTPLQLNPVQFTQLSRQEKNRVTGIFSISSRQREILLLWCSGLNRTVIAEKLGFDKSTVCRTLKRAQHNLRQLAEARMTVDRLRHDNRLDVSDPEVGKFLVSALTPHQAVCFYLYYSEQLSVREVGQLLQVDHSTICRTVQRAVARISDVLGDSIGILENVEELDELVYLIYCNLRDRYDDLPPSVQEHIKLTQAAEYIDPASPRKSGEELFSIRKPKIRIRTNRKALRGTLRPDQHGRLFRALMERYQSVKAKGQWKNPIARWLITIFQVISRPQKPL